MDETLQTAPKKRGRRPMTEEQKKAAAEKRVAKAKEANELPTAEDVRGILGRATVNVTYHPREQTDPNWVVWNNIKFYAFKPIALDPVKHVVEVDIPVRVTLPDGRAATQTRPVTVSMIDLAKDNPSFEVEGFPRAQAIKPKTKVPPPGAEWAGTNRDELVSLDWEQAQRILGESGDNPGLSVVQTA